MTPDTPISVDPLAAFYVDVLSRLEASQIAFLVGGTFAYSRYTRIPRDTKDMDIFVRPADVRRALNVLEEAGYATDMPFPHWLGKVRRGDDVIDLLFNSGNGIAEVDDDWFTYAAVADVLGMRLRLCPIEEMIWSKAFVQERERFDGADVLHLLREAGRDVNWTRLLARFGDHWPVLLSHLVLFRFVYPNQRDSVPSSLIHELMRRVIAQKDEPANRVCYGTLLSREQYLHDIDQLGYLDARVGPRGTMTRAETQIWTDAIKKHE
jgi:hypothetical protein